MDKNETEKNSIRKSGYGWRSAQQLACELRQIYTKERKGKSIGAICRRKDSHLLRCGHRGQRDGHIAEETVMLDLVEVQGLVVLAMRGRRVHPLMHFFFHEWKKKSHQGEHSQYALDQGHPFKGKDTDC